ncbi:hypothetical protein LTR15_010377 [Elasticomyces elasticus]|nr:hypothetical protein LTR15_010377 [Elasticomyces elasticus]
MGNKQYGVVNLERSLGFDFPGGIQRSHRLLGDGYLKSLLLGVEPIEKHFASVATAPCAAYSSKELKDQCRSLLDDFGCKIWSDEPVRDYLTSAQQNDLAGFYPEDLYWSNELHRARLHSVFHNLVAYKCAQYLANERRRLSQKAREPDTPLVQYAAPEFAITPNSPNSLAPGQMMIPDVVPVSASGVRRLSASTAASAATGLETKMGLSPERALSVTPAGSLLEQIRAAAKLHRQSATPGPSEHASVPSHLKTIHDKDSPGILASPFATSTTSPAYSTASGKKRERSQATTPSLSSPNK